MKILVYDSTFEGFLTAVFVVFEYRYEEVAIVAQHLFAPSLFEEAITENRLSRKNSLYLLLNIEIALL